MAVASLQFPYGNTSACIQAALMMTVTSTAHTLLESVLPCSAVALKPLNPHHHVLGAMADVRQTQKGGGRCDTSARGQGVLK